MGVRFKRNCHYFGLPAILCWGTSLCIAAAWEPPGQDLEPGERHLWRDGIGSGFEEVAHTLTLEAGANYGVVALGSTQAHHLALLSASYGFMVGGMQGEGHWCQGNLEFRTELFGGFEFSPDHQWLIGLTPHLRYHFVTGTRWVPYLDVGAGVTATGIGPPDLSNTFEFNLQGGIGVHYFLTERLALTADLHYLHLSCAGISKPNLGLNGVLMMIGVTRAF